MPKGVPYATEAERVAAKKRQDREAELRRRERRKKDPEYAAKAAEQRRRASLAYYHRNKAKVNAKAAERAAARRAKVRAERAAKGLRPRQRVLFRQKDPLWKILGNLPPVRRTEEEKREYYRAWAERRRRRMGMLTRDEWRRKMAERAAKRTESAPSRAAGGWEALERAEHRRREALSAVYAGLEGELAELAAAQEKEMKLDGRYAQESWGPLSLDGRTFDDGDAWQLVPTALIEPDFADSLLERIS